jgi:hypothetical protein
MHILCIPVSDEREAGQLQLELQHADMCRGGTHPRSVGAGCHHSSSHMIILGILTYVVCGSLYIFWLQRYEPSMEVQAFLIMFIFWPIIMIGNICLKLVEIISDLSQREIYNPLYWFKVWRNK